MRNTRYETGSALILAVVLTSLLAVVGVMFLMAARVDKIATSAISENKQLNYAVETIVAKISQELILDTPGIGGQRDYYDYPGEGDEWLASLEPYENGSDYKWRQISDVTGYINRKWGRSAQEKVATDFVKDHGEIELDNSNDLDDQLADADGDGVADSKWIELEDVTSSKGKPIYAAIRVIDNGAMLNLNTAYKFDANNIPTDANLIDGSSQMQINLAGLSQRGITNGSLDEAAEKLQDWRCGDESSDEDDIPEYEENVVWRYYRPEDGEKYVPFDISDELELRNRYLLNHQYIEARIENLWTKAFKSLLETPLYSGGSADLDDWFNKVQYDVSEPNANDKYSYRHIGTVLNIDRIIDPNGSKMVNINNKEVTDPCDLYNALISGIDPEIDIDDKDREQIAERFAQLAVNIIDFADDDIEVETFEPNNITYYGFEAQPFITEIGIKIDTLPEAGANYFAVELYNPFDKDINLHEQDGEFELLIVDSNAPDPDPNDPNDARHIIKFKSEDLVAAKGCFVVSNNLSKFRIFNKSDNNTEEDSNFEFFGDWQPADKSKPPRDRRREPDESKPPAYIGWGLGEGDVLLLRRRVEDANGDGDWIYIDKQIIDTGWAPASSESYYGRDVRDWHIVYQTLARDRDNFFGDLGRKNNIDPERFENRNHDFSFFLPNPLRPEQEFVTVGDISRILTVGPDTSRDNSIGQQLRKPNEDEEEQIRLDMQNPYLRNVFQYLTVFDPASDGIDNDGDGIADSNETELDKIPGRININTAPWYVMAQLPWVSDELAQAIVAYRDKLKLGVEPSVDYYDNDDPNSNSRYKAIDNAISSFGFEKEDIREDAGFASIGELNFVVAPGNSGNDYSIARYALDNDDLEDFPDLTRDGLNKGDDIEDDFEERDVIFSRISNLVTVRSDIFTAYILVRIGINGPQKRAIAILDRSNVYSADGKVRIVALHYVPDPR